MTGKENGAVSSKVMLGQPQQQQQQQGEVTLNHLSRRMAEFAADREWDQFHSPRNLLLALVIFFSLPFCFFFCSSPCYVSSANSQSVGGWLLERAGPSGFGVLSLPVDLDLSSHAVWRGVEIVLAAHAYCSWILVFRGFLLRSLAE